MEVEKFIYKGLVRLPAAELCNIMSVSHLPHASDFQTKNRHPGDFFFFSAGA